MSGLEPWVGALDMLTDLVAWAFMGQRRRRPPQVAWSDAAEICHLVRVAADTWIAPAGDGTSGELRLRCLTWWVGDDQYGTRLFVDAPDRWIVNLGLAPETAATDRAKERGAREIETGDDAFDDAFYVTGPEPSVRAVLDSATRSLLLALLVEVHLVVAGGELRGLVTRGDSSEQLHGRLLSRTLPLVFEAARRLRRPDDVAARLAHNARTDPNHRVRRENLLCLARDHPDSEATRQAIRTACADSSADVRVRAAAVLGAEGWPTLLAVALDPEAEDLPAARAIAALGEHLATDEVRTLLAEALRSRRPETARECLSSLGRRGEAEAIPAIAKVLAVDQGPLAVAAAEALAQSGRAEAEAPLLAALGRPAPELRRASAAALGRVGTLASVAPLRESETSDADDATRRAARHAVAEIQSRLPGASQGQLSLAPADAGALSLAGDETGRLSLPETGGPRPGGQ